MILGVGTVALDTVETPAGSAHEVPGGSALYFAAAASRLGPVAVVGVTGEDFPAEAPARLAARGVDVSGIRRLAEPTFRWHARYDASGAREVVWVHRGAVVRTPPTVPPALRDPEVLFLGSTDPEVQSDVLRQAGQPGAVILDTMPHWIREGGGALEAILRRVDVLLVNEEEVCILGVSADEGGAAQAARSMGPAWVVVKRGASGARAYGQHELVEVPAVHLAHVVDPTGAGDAFAGGLAASLGAARSLSADAVRRALEVGVRMGALAISDFSFEGLMRGLGPP